MASWTPQSIREHIIKYVQLHSCLFDTKDPAYNVRDITDPLWAMLGEDLEMAGPKVKSLWRNLKDSYRVQKKKIHRMGKGEKIKKWYFYDMMYFIDKFIEICPSNAFPLPKSEYLYYDDDDASKDGKQAMDESLQGDDTFSNEDNIETDQLTDPPAIKRQLDDSSTSSASKKRILSEEQNNVPSSSSSSHQRAFCIGKSHQNTKHDQQYRKDHRSTAASQLQSGYRTCWRSNSREPSLYDNSNLYQQLQQPTRDDPEAAYGAHVASMLRSLTPRQRQLAKIKIEAVFYNIQFPDDPTSEQVVSISLPDPTIVKTESLPMSIFKNWDYHNADSNEVDSEEFQAGEMSGTS